jgi:CRP-like cAMP-binding protein
VKFFLESAGLGRKVVKFRAKETVFAQGEPAKNVIYIQEGGVKLPVVKEAGKEAVVTILGPGDFLGGGCLADQLICMATASAIAPTIVLVIEKDEMIRAAWGTRVLRPLHRVYADAEHPGLRGPDRPALQLQRETTKRLARSLLLLARYGAPGHPHKALPKVSQEMLAEMIGTTRSRVNLFMNK